MLVEKSRRLGIIIEIMNKKSKETRRVDIIMSLFQSSKKRYLSILSIRMTPLRSLRKTVFSAFQPLIHINMKKEKAGIK